MKKNSNRQNDQNIIYLKTNSDGKLFLWKKIKGLFYNQEEINLNKILCISNLLPNIIYAQILLSFYISFSNCIQIKMIIYKFQITSGLIKFLLFQSIMITMKNVSAINFLLLPILKYLWTHEENF